MAFDKIYQLDKRISNRTFFLIYLGGIVLWCLLFSFQGLNADNDGWMLTGFQQIFNDPSSVEYQLLYYLSLVIGGAWNLLFGWMGLYSSRLLAILVVSVTATVSYFFFRHVVNRWIIFIGAIILLASCQELIRTASYNEESCMFSLMSCYLLFKSLSTGKSSYIFFAGLVLGMNVFVRLPNLALCLLIFIMIPYVIYNGKKNLFKLLGSAVVGFVVGMSIIVLLMLILGHFHIFIDAINNLTSSGRDTESTHNLDRMLSVYINNYKAIFLQSISIYIFPLIAYIVMKVGYLKTNRKKICILLLVLMILSIFYSTFKIDTVSSLEGFLMIILVLSICLFHDSPAIVYSSAIALAATNTQYLGSDAGIFSFGEVYYLSFPLALGLMPKLVRKIFIEPEVRWMIYAFFMAYFSLYEAKGVNRMLLHTHYNENSPVWTMWYRPKAPLATTLISKENKLILDSAYVEVNKYVRKNDYLACIEHMPIMNYLTQTRPYFYNSWLWSYDPNNLRLHIAKAENEIKVLPVILICKSNSGQYANYDPDWNNPHAVSGQNFGYNSRLLLYKSFIRRHQYRKVWENDHFVILVPLKKAIF